MVEEDDHVQQQQGGDCIVRSLAFDSSYAWADDLRCHEGGGCKVAFLVASISENQKPRASQKRRAGGRFDFPLRCHRCRNVSEVCRRDWDESVLERICIKYVDKIQDVVKFLAYAPSLPEALRPDAICLLGLHRLLPSRVESGTRGAGVMELIHVMSLLSDTAEVLGKMKQCDEGSSRRVPYIVTMNQSTYQATARNIEGHLHQWVDFVACARSDSEKSQAGMLVFKNTALLAGDDGCDDKAADLRSVPYTVQNDEKGQFIRWNG